MVITYARLWNLGNYENERIEVQATVAEGQEAGAVAAELRALVDAQHAAFEAARRAEEEERRAARRAEEEERRRRYMEERQRERDALEAERKARAKVLDEF